MVSGGGGLAFLFEFNPVTLLKNYKDRVNKNLSFQINQDQHSQSL